MTQTRKSGRLKTIPEAARIHEEALVVDLHVDTFMWTRFFRQNIRRRHRPPYSYNPFSCHADLPRLKEGGVNACLFGVVVGPHRSGAYLKRAHRAIDAMDAAIAANRDLVREVRSAEGIRRVARQGRIAALKSLEGAHPLKGRIDNLFALYARGVRSVTLAHFTSNEAAASNFFGNPPFRGLTEFGRRLVREMNNLGVVIDVAHVEKRGLLDACSLSEKPVIASHTGVAALRPVRRNLDDECIRAVAATGGVVGVIFHPPYLGRHPWPDLGAVADHLEHVCDVAGPRHAAIGSDFDGLIWTPRGLGHVGALPRLTRLLYERGFAEEDLKGILGENFLRVLEEVRGS